MHENNKFLAFVSHSYLYMAMINTTDTREIAQNRLDYCKWAAEIGTLKVEDIADRWIKGLEIPGLVRLCEEAGIKLDPEEIEALLTRARDQEALRAFDECVQKQADGTLSIEDIYGCQYSKGGRSIGLLEKIENAGGYNRTEIDILKVRELKTDAKKQQALRHFATCERLAKEGRLFKRHISGGTFGGTHYPGLRELTRNAGGLKAIGKTVNDMARLFEVARANSAPQTSQPAP